MAFLRSPWIEILLITITSLVYAPVRHFQFVNWDDPQYITENPHVQAGMNWQSLWWALTTGYTPYWHPVTWLSHLLDVQLFGFDAGAHHVVNVMIHAANSLLLFHWLRNLTGNRIRSGVVAALFAVHPLHVESVAWVTERKDVLSTLFVLMTLNAYVSYARERHWSWYVATVAFFVLALMSKPMVVTLPLVLLLLDYWPLERIDRGRPVSSWMALVLEKVPLVVPAVATSIATLIIQSRIGAVAPIAALPIGPRVSNAVVSYIAYLRKTVWPVDLAAFYPLHPLAIPLVLGATLLLSAISAGVVISRRHHPYLFVGWFWYLVTLAPVSGFLQAGEQALADRFMYVPLVGLLIAMAWGAPELLGRWKLRELVFATATVSAVALCAALARAQVRTWTDSVTLWQHALTVTSRNYKAYEKLGEAQRDMGRLDEALASYRNALATAPDVSPGYAAVIHNDLGLVLVRQGKGREAIKEFEDAVHLNPTFAEAQLNFGNALAEEGRLSDAVDHFRSAIRLGPGHVEGHVGMGNALLKQGKADEAIPHYREAIRLKPDLGQAHTGLGSALATQGSNDEAIAEYREALRLEPQSSVTHVNLAILLIGQGRAPEARQHLEAALRIDPSFETARELMQRIGKGK